MFRRTMRYLPALSLVFVALKLTGHIAWSWVWVLAPLWIIPVILLASVGATFLYAYLMHRYLS
ncbi:hypothetical protein EP7_004351 [Isosphaeraceae bacterium EP7]